MGAFNKIVGRGGNYPHQINMGEKPLGRVTGEDIFAELGGCFTDDPRAVINCGSWARLPLPDRQERTAGGVVRTA